MKVINDFLENIEKQKNGISCGPACMSMLSKYIEKTTKKSGGLSIDDFAVMAGTNSEIGTVPDGIRTAFRGAGINYEFRTADDDEASVKKHLKESIDLGRPIMIRSLIYGIKHWQIVIGYDASGVLIADPAIGTCFLKWSECLDRMKMRGWDRFVIDPNTPMKNIKIEMAKNLMKNKDVETVMGAIEICMECFENHGGTTKMFNDALWRGIDISPILIVDGVPKGVYILDDVSCEWILFVKDRNLRKIINENGAKAVAHGYALAVTENSRQGGYGRLLKEVPKKLGFDAIIGQQFRSLNNLDHWMKHRFLTGETKETTTTMEIYGLDKEIVENELKKSHGSQLKI